MKACKLLLYALFVLSLAAGNGLADEIFRFAVLCDSRGQLATSRCEDDNYGVNSTLDVMVKDIVARNAAESVKLVLFPGDMIHGVLKRDAPSVAECNRVSLNHWREVVSPLLKAGMIMRVTVGNHETVVADASKPRLRCGDHLSPYFTEMENFKVFREVLGDMIDGTPGPESDLGLTYSFDMGGCHFAVLAAYTMFYHGTFSNETIDWLDWDLSKAREAGLKTFVVSHPPAFPGGGHMWDSLPFFNPTYNCDNYDGRFGIDRRKERDRFWNILKKHGVVAYFCGHEHNIQVQEVEGVWHVVSGGLTPRLYPLNGSKADKQRNTILYDGAFQNPRASVIWPWNDGQQSYWGWCLVTVEGEKVTLDVIGSAQIPTKRTDLKLLKSFVIKDKPTGPAPGS
jgi:hypothetical protein